MSGPCGVGVVGVVSVVSVVCVVRVVYVVCVVRAVRVGPCWSVWSGDAHTQAPRSVGRSCNGRTHYSVARGRSVGRVTAAPERTKLPLGASTRVPYVSPLLPLVSDIATGCMHAGLLSTDWLPATFIAPDLMHAINIVRSRLYACRIACN